MAPAEKRLVFRNELRRVGTESARVLRLLGSKVQKMEKLGPGDFLCEVHEAAEQLQIMVDKKSYLFVNSESWELGKRENPKVVDNYLDINDDETYFEEYESSNETAIDIERVRLSRSLSDKFTSEIMTDTHLSRTFSGPMVAEQEEVQWPGILDRQWSSEPVLFRTYESAASLTL